MNKDNKLGMGLGALLSTNTNNGNQGVKKINISQIIPNPSQPRKNFIENELKELSLSIKNQGLIQPIIVRPVDDGQYQIIAGERRWRAAQIAQLDNIPAIIKTLSDDDALEIAIIENVQRSNLNPIDEAAGYQRLIDIYNYTQEDLAQVIGKSRSYIANILRLNNLPTKVKDYLSEGLLTIGHARALISLENAENLADMIVSKGLSVRQIEQLVKNPVGSQKQSKRSSIKDKNLSSLEQLMTDAIGLKVQIHAKDAKSGKVVVNYTSDQHLELIKNKLLG